MFAVAAAAAVPPVPEDGSGGAGDEDEVKSGLVGRSRWRSCLIRIAAYRAAWRSVPVRVTFGTGRARLRCSRSHSIIVSAS